MLFCAPLQDKYHLYFLFDLMSGGDLMDVLVSEAQVCWVCAASEAPSLNACFASSPATWPAYT